jgi:hypothetical protein
VADFKILSRYLIGRSGEKKHENVSIVVIEWKFEQKTFEYEANLSLICCRNTVPGA